MSKEAEAAALAALQGGNNETTETEPAREPESVPPEEAAGETNAEEGAGESQSDGGEDEQVDDGGQPEVGKEDDPSGEATTDLATMDDVHRMEVHKDWIKTLTPRIPKGVSINNEGEMSIAADAVDNELGDMVEMFSEADLRAGKMSIRCKFYMATTVYELAARNGVAPDQVIDELDLCNKTGRDYDTVYSWCKALAELPDGCFHPNLTMSHYVLASRVTKPQGAKAVKKFNKKRIKLLKEAAVDPESMSARQIARELKQVTAALDKKKPDALKRESIGVIHDRLIDNYRVYRVAGVSPDILTSNGITMADLVNQIEADENELINRHKIVEDAAQIVLHWTDNPTVDVTATEGEEDASTHTEGESKEPESEEASDSEKTDPKNRKNEKKEKVKNDA